METAATQTGISRFKLSRIESGQTPTKHEDLERLFTYYELTDDSLRSTLQTLAHEASRSGWWECGTPSQLPVGMDKLLCLEPIAWRILCYEPRWVPELLQTDEYASAALQIAYPDKTTQDIERLVELNQRRQEDLLHASWTRAWFLVEEAALRMPIGDTGVWRRQLEHLHELSQHRSLCLQVVREHAAGPARIDHGFLYLAYSDGDLSDTVSFQRLNNFEYEQSPKLTRRYYEQFHALAVYAERPGDAAGDTADVITALRDGTPLPPRRRGRFRYTAASGPWAPDAPRETESLFSVNETVRDERPGALGGRLRQDADAPVR